MLWGGRARRRRAALAGRMVPGPVRDLLAAAPVDPRTDVAQLRLLAMDFETTGLDPRRDHIVSVGFVPVDGLEIRLAGAGRLLCRATAEVGESAAVHGITDDALRDGIPLAELVEQVAGALAGRALLAHHAVIETGFLSAATELTHGATLAFVAVDTMQLQARVLGADPEHVPPGALRLPTARAHLGLPRYRSHDALTDALACAELYLAQVAMLSGGRGMTLSSLLRA